MGTDYTGFEPRTFSVQPSGKGRFISGLAIDDDDQLDAAHIDPLPMASMDDVQFLAWRTVDWVSGDAMALGGIVTFTGTSPNGIQFQCPVAFNGAHGNATFAKDAFVQSGSTFFFGSNAIGSAGHAVFDAGGAGAGSSLTMLNGALITTDAKIVFNGAQPAVSTNVGVDNAVNGINTARALAFVFCDGAGNVTCPEGHNITSVALVADASAVANQAVKITFVRAMANTDLMVNVTAMNTANTDRSFFLLNVSARTANDLTIVGVRVDDFSIAGPTSPQVIDFSTQPIRFAVSVFARQ